MKTTMLLIMLLMVGVIGSVHVQAQTQTQAPTQSDSSGTMYVKQGLDLYRQGRFNESIQAFDNALAANPDSLDALDYKAGILAFQGKYNESIPLYDQAIEINKNDIPAWSGKGRVLMAQSRYTGDEKYNESIRAFNEAIRITPVTARDWINRGYAQLGADGYLDAAKSFDKAAAIASKDDDIVQLNYAYALYIFGMPDEAVKTIDRIIAANPNNAIAWYTRGVLLNSIANRQTAIQREEVTMSYDRALAINPGFDLAKQARAGRQTAIIAS